MLLFALLISLSAHADQLDDLCKERGGKIFKKYTCPKSGLKLPIKTCEYKNQDGDIQFVNGCSGPSGGHGEVFFMACIQHDLCYHHEPSTNGLSRKQCDQLMLEIATESCMTDPRVKDRKKCRGWAKTMYNALRVVGGIAYHCEDSPANY